ncbi:MAG TPA: GNAT family N-acetyltransferase [Anaerolineae bacterium]|nr:GNAT family N-acetyltransferase [Anaerolineae bacterium]
MTTTAKLYFSPESFTLADGTRATLRAVRPADAPLIQAFVSRLSPQSIYYRFLSTITGVSDAEAAHLATVDYHDRMALVATVLSPDEELIPPKAGDYFIIAVARYARSLDQADRAEFAVVVEDRYQGQGLARTMLNRMGLYARQHGIRAFTGTINGGNLRMRQFVKNCGLPTQVSAGDHGELEVVVLLEA